MKDTSDIIQSYETGRGKRYSFDFQLRGIRCRRSGFLTSEECYAVMIQVRMDIWKGIYSPERYFSPLQKDITLQGFWNNYHLPKIQRTLKKRTVMNRQGSMNKHALPVLGKVKIRSIDNARLTEYFNYLSQKGLAQSTLATHYGYLRKILMDAYSLGFITETPTFKVKMKLTREKKILTKEEARTLLKTVRESNDISENIKILIQMMFWTGLRVGEITTLKVSDFDFTNDRLTISRTAGYNKGEVTKTKTSKVESIPLHPEARSLALQIINNNNKLINDWMFPVESGHFVSVKTVQRSLRIEAIKALGKDEGKKVTPHSLRRSLASLLVDENTPLDAVASLLRHTKKTLVTSYNRANIKVLETKYFKFEV